MRRARSTILVVAVLAALMAIVVTDVVAKVASFSTGVQSIALPDSVREGLQRYMLGNGSRPATPQGTDRVGVVTGTKLDVEPWFMDQKSTWHATVFTADKGQLIRLDVWIGKDPKGIARQIRAGDYIAISWQSDSPPDAIYNDKNGVVGLTKLQQEAVSIPSQN
jgi:hypothetical protein